MSDIFSQGDFLIFQIEAGYGLLRFIDITHTEDARIWHISAYSDMFMDIESAEEAIEFPEKLGFSIAHAALTERAFLSTQVSKLGNKPLALPELQKYTEWQNDPQREVSDRSIRLLLGLR